MVDSADIKSTSTKFAFAKATLIYKGIGIKEMIHYKKIAIIFIGAIWMVLAFFTPGPAAVKKVAVLPFQINAAEDLSYLREGIMDMLASRLSWEGKVEVIEKPLVKKAMAASPRPLDEAKARQVGGKLGADYVLFGSLTVVGNSVSIDAKMIPLTGEGSPVTVYEQAKSMGEVIPKINDFAEAINGKLFGRQMAAAAPPPKPKFSQEHPERLLSRQGSEAISPVPGGSFEIMQQAPGAGGTRSDLWRSQRLEFPVNGMDVGDIDGDGRPEIVVLSRFREVLVYRWAQGSLIKLASFETSRLDRLVWVCVLDGNGDGRAEIYVNNIRNDILSSFVLEWQGGRLAKTAGEVPWYFNRVFLPEKGMVLIGQKKTPDDIFMPGIYLLQSAGGKYSPLDALRLPKEANVFNFLQADLNGDGRVETVLIGFEDKLYLFDDTGKRLWRSRDYYGATANKIPPRKSIQEEYMKDRSGVVLPEPYYIPSPLILSDLNSDGKPEVLVNQNTSFLSRLLMKQRNFSNGQIMSLVWDGYELLPQWKTRPIDGMVVSYRLADVDGDGADELVAMVLKDKEFLKASKSVLFVYELGQVRQQPAAVPPVGQQGGS